MSAEWPSGGGGGVGTEEDPIASPAVVVERESRIAADAAEAATRAQRDTTLGEQIDDEEAARAGADQTLTTAVAAKADSTTAATKTEVSTEKSAREGADSTLTTAVATEKSRAETAEGLKASKTELGTETTNRESGDSTEKSRAETAEALKLARASNLSDLANAGTARTNLGLGTAAVKAEGAFAAASHTHAESDVTNLVTDLAERPMTEKIYAPILWANSPRIASGAPSAPGAKAFRGVRFRCPKAGTISALYYYVGASSGNVLGQLTDVGEASSAVYTKLWDSGSVAVGTVNTWQTVGNPGLSVTRGQELIAWIVFDNGTATFGRSENPATTGSIELPPAMWSVPSGMTKALLGAGITASEFKGQNHKDESVAAIATLPLLLLKIT